MTRIGWIDASSGASGDMLLGAIHDTLTALGGDVSVMARSATAVVPVDLVIGHEVRSGFRVARAVVTSREESPPHRTWATIREVLSKAEIDQRVTDLASRTFERLAIAEAGVHGVAPDEIHFHEVGAHDAVADIVGVCAGFVELGLDALIVSPIALGGGTAMTAHGTIPIPGPAVLELLRHSGLGAFGGPDDVERCTPTGAALLAELATGSGPMPAMAVLSTGLGAGSRSGGPGLNALRLIVGDPVSTDSASHGVPGDVVIETNVDDLDPRLWPAVLTRLMAAGASDAWLTPILMKKGRPAHTLHVLVGPDQLLRKQIEDIIFTETTAIGVRVAHVDKVALDRQERVVEVDGQRIRVKVASREGRVLNAQPEYDDVAAAAAALGLAAKLVLGQAISALAPNHL